MFRRPQFWFPLALLALAAVGAAALVLDSATQPDAKDLRFYWAYHYWRCAFDALSAACGSGLLLYDFDRSYTSQGRWTLIVIGVIGAVLFLSALVGTLRRGNGEAKDLPRVRRVVACFLVAVGGAAVLASACTAIARVPSSLSDSTINAVAAFASLDWWIRRTPSAAEAGIYYAISTLSALGWMFWAWASIPLPHFRPPWQTSSRVIGAAVLSVTLLACGGLFGVLQAPRGEAEMQKEGGARAALSGETRDDPQWQFIPLAAQATALRDGSKMVLGCCALLGGLPGSPASGLGFLGLIVLLTGLLGARGRRDPLEHDAARRQRCFGAALLLGVLVAASVIALVLLLIENQFASRYESPPTFADAFLDACSAFAGGGMSSGITATITDRRLSAGMGQSADRYQYGMVWLMLAMWVGRVLPVFVLARAAKTESE